MLIQGDVLHLQWEGKQTARGAMGKLWGSGGRPHDAQSLVLEKDLSRSPSPWLLQGEKSEPGLQEKLEAQRAPWEGPASPSGSIHKTLVERNSEF